MMEFGLGSFLEKFETRFGSRATSCLLVLIALAASAICVNVIATYAIIPAIDLIEKMVSSDQVSYKSLKTIQVVANLFLFVLVFAGIRTAWEANKDREAANDYIEKYGIFRDFAVKFWDETDGIHSELRLAFDAIEYARTKRERDAAVLRARAILDKRQKDYSEGVLRFNKTVGDETASSAS